MKYAFVDHDGRFSFEVEDRVITNVDTSAKKFISENEATLLGCLIEGRKSKGKVMSAVWLDRGIVVADSSYYQLVMQLRKSFDQIGLPKNAIRTIPRYGLELAVRPLADDVLIEQPCAAPNEVDAVHCPPAPANLGRTASGSAQDNARRGILARLLPQGRTFSAGRVGVFLSGLLGPAWF
jgi:DNA-binding winged helix-turn-helix (wHTH) protein